MSSRVQQCESGISGWRGKRIVPTGARYHGKVAAQKRTQRAAADGIGPSKEGADATIQYSGTAKFAYNPERLLLSPAVEALDIWIGPPATDVPISIHQDKGLTMRSFLLFSAVLICLSGMQRAAAQDSLPQPVETPPGQAQRSQAGQSAQPGATGTLPGAAPAPPDEATYRQQYSYALGRNFAGNLKQNEIECDLPFLMAGITDVIKNSQPKWTEAELEAALDRFGQEMQQKGMARMKREGAENEKKANDFLAQNAKREGVQTTASGLQYRVLKPGTGLSPTLGDRVQCNYRGMLLDGTEFDNSARHGGPAEFGVNEVIPGWTEALQKMKVGEKWQLFVPPRLGYDLNPPPGSPIGPNSLLVFEIELLDIVKP
jgi:FKBP-type peptidyl-prolyl cis-trans isomerase FklB